MQRLPIILDITTQSRVDFVHAASHTSQKYLIETMGGGVAMFDYDGDGRLDLYFVNGAALRDPMPDGAVPDKSDRRYWNRLSETTEMEPSRMLRRRRAFGDIRTEWVWRPVTTTTMAIRTCMSRTTAGTSYIATMAMARSPT